MSTRGDPKRLTRAEAGVLVTINWETDGGDTGLRVAAVANDPGTVVSERFLSLSRDRELASFELYDAVVATSRAVASEITRLRAARVPAASGDDDGEQAEHTR